MISVSIFKAAMHYVILHLDDVMTADSVLDEAGIDAEVGGPPPLNTAHLLALPKERNIERSCSYFSSIQEFQHGKKEFLNTVY